MNNNETLPKSIDTNEEVRAWEEYLLKQNKEDLVAFLLDKMIMDIKFFDLVRVRFANDKSNQELHEVLSAFDNEINIAYKAKKVDTDFVIAITKHFARELESFDNIEKKEAYSHMIDKLNEGIENYSLGWPDDFEVCELIESLEGSIGE